MVEAGAELDIGGAEERGSIFEVALALAADIRGVDRGAVERAVETKVGMNDEDGGVEPGLEDEVEWDI